MGEELETFRVLREHTRALRKKYGVNCLGCALHRPRAPASILIPQQRCRVDGYRDPRPELTNEQWSDA